MAQNANTSIVQRINPEDIQGAPSWLPQLLGPLNNFMQSVNSQLAGGLSIPGNVVGQINSYNFTTNSNYSPTDVNTFTPYSFKSTLPYQTRVLILGKINIVSSQVQFVENTVVISDWADSNGVVTIYMVTGLKPNTQYNITTLSF